MIITHSIPTTNNLMDRNRVRLSNNKNMNKFLLEAASCQYSMCNQYKVFVLTHTSKLKLEKSIVLFP